MSEFKDPILPAEDVQNIDRENIHGAIYQLSPGMEQELQLEQPQYGDTPVIADIATTSDPDIVKYTADTYSIVDLRNAKKTPTGEIMYQGYAFRPEISFLVISKNADFDHGKGYKGIRQNEGEVPFGRFDPTTMKSNDHRSRFESSSTTSRCHFSVEYNGSTLKIRDKGSLQGTLIRAEVKSEKSSEIQHETLGDKKLQALKYLRENLNQHSDEKNSILYGSAKLLRMAEQIIQDANEPNVIDEIVDIATKEILNEVVITPDLGKWNAVQQYDKRIKILDIYKDDPEFARLLVTEHVAGFHGSRSGNLWGVLEHDGLLSAAEARNNGQILSSGERTYSQESGQDAISFADFRFPDSIRQYSGTKIVPRTVQALENEYVELIQAQNEAIGQWGPDHPFAYNAGLVAQDVKKQIEFIQNNPNSVEAELMLANFPIAYGVSIDKYDIVPTMKDKKNGVLVERVPSDIPGEFQIIDTKVPMDRIPIVAVPEQYIERVDELLRSKAKTNVKVVDIALLTRDPIVR